MVEVDAVIDVTRQALWCTLLVASPLLLSALLVGAVVAVLQAVTQIQDSTIALVPKVLAVFLTVAICLPWLVEQMLDFSRQLWGTVPPFVGGG